MKSTTLLFASLLLLQACGEKMDALPVQPDGGADALSDSATVDSVGVSDSGSLDAATDPGGDAPSADAGRDSFSADASGDVASADSGSSDAASTDTGTDAPPDSGTADSAGACHAFGFGAPAVRFTNVAALPAMTGGTIPLGRFDATSVMTTGALTGTYRGSWVFESGSRLQILEQITLSGAPPPETPRTLSYRTAGSALSRTEMCPGVRTFDNTYTVGTDASGRTTLSVRQGTIMFSFTHRP